MLYIAHLYVTPTHIVSLIPLTVLENTCKYHCYPRGYMMWNADFTWLVQPGRDVPIMSGGLLALSKKWWEERHDMESLLVQHGEQLAMCGKMWQSYMPFLINQVGLFANQSHILYSSHVQSSNFEGRTVAL